LDCIPPPSCPHLIVDPFFSSYRGVNLGRGKYHAFSMSGIAEKVLDSLDRVSELNKVLLFRAIFEAEVLMFPRGFWGDDIIQNLM